MALNASNLFSVEGFVTVITGAGSGLGRTMALALDANHASKVFILGRDEQTLLETASQATNKTITPIQTDITSHESLKEAYSTISAQTTHIDVLICNSGITGHRALIPPNPDGSPISLTQFRDHHFSQPMEDFTHVLDTNVTGTHYTILALLPLLEAAKSNRPAPQPNVLAPPLPQIILLSSLSAYLKQPPGVAYAASKAAILHLVSIWASHMAPYQIRVNGIAPGRFYSAMTEGTFRRFGVEGRGVQDGAFLGSEIPVTRAGGEEDLAGLMLWMVGRSGGYLNGETVVLDGGRRGVVP